MIRAAALLLAAAALCPPALAQSEGLDDVKAVDETTLDAYRFSIGTCDTIRAEVLDERPADARRSPEVVIQVRNTGQEMCLYKGIVLKGFLSGTYAVSRTNNNETGFFIAPGDDIALKITLDEPEGPRHAVQMQIPPDRGIIVLKGLRTPDGE